MEVHLKPTSQTQKSLGIDKDSVPLDKNFGDAYISPKHCNFVNKGNASSEDMLNLINYVRKTVLEKLNSSGKRN